MATKAKEQDTDKQDGTLPEPLQKIESTPVGQAITSSPVTKRIIQPIVEFFKKFSNDWTMNLQAGALAYNLLLAIFPIAVALLSIVGLILGNLAPAVQQNLIQGISQALPSQSSGAVIDQIFTNLSKASGVLGIIAIITAIFGGSRLFITIENCFDLIYHQRPRSFLPQNIMAIGMMFLFALLVPLMVLASTGPALVLSFLQSTPLSSIPGSNYLFSLGGVVSSLIVAWILFEAIYIIVPNQHISFRASWRGAVVAAIALQIYLTLFPLYTTYFLGGYGGQVGFAIILIVFFYYFAMILLLGASINAFFAEGIRETPDNLASIVHEQTSHDADTKGEIERQAPPSHKGNEPEGASKPSSQGQGQSTEASSEKQPVKVKKVQVEKSSSFGASRKGTLIEVAMGTILATIITLIGQRRKGKQY